MRQFETLHSAVVLATVLGLGSVTLSACTSEQPNTPTTSDRYLTAVVEDTHSNGINAMLADGSSAFLPNGTSITFGCIESGDFLGLHGNIESGDFAGDQAVELPRTELKALNNPYQNAGTDPFTPVTKCP